MGSTTRLAIMQQMAKALGLYLSGTLTSAAGIGTSSFVDTTRRHEQDDYPSEGFILTLGGTGSGQEHRISDFANGTQTGTIYGTWAAALDTTSTYGIFLPPVTPDDYRSAIDAVRSKLAAKGICRREIDTSLAVTRSGRYALPSVIDVELNEVWCQRREWLPDNLWDNDAADWTLHANASLTNDGPNGERTLKLIATGAAENSYADIDVSGLEEFEFWGSVKGTGAVAARWRYQVMDDAGTVIVGPSLIGAGNSAATWVDQTATIKLPVNAATLRILFDAAGAGTVYAQAAQLMELGDWEKLPAAWWRTDYDGTTEYLSFEQLPRAGSRLRLVGRRTLEALAADSDTISLDEPELVAFVEKCMSEAWRQFGGMLPSFDAGQVEAEIAKHEREYEKVVGPLGRKWKARRSAASPIWGSLH